MFTIKDGFDFDQLGRRGIQAVRDELLEITKPRVLTSPVCQISEEKPNACRNTGEMIKPLGTQSLIHPTPYPQTLHPKCFSDGV